MQARFILATLVVIFLVLLSFGYIMGNNSIDVDGCPAQWKSTSVTVGASELCSAQSCSALPAEQQHNAIVDAITCACAKESGGGFTNAAAASRIQEVTSLYFGYNLTADAICGTQGQQFLVRHAYG